MLRTTTTAAARPLLGYVVLHFEVIARSPLATRFHHFLEFSTFSTTISRACSATMFFGQRFSRSSSLSRLGSRVLILPYSLPQRRPSWHRADDAHSAWTAFLESRRASDGRA